MKMRFFFTGVTISLLSLSGCSNSDEMDGVAQKPGKVPMNITANVPQTRADYTDGGSTMTFSWRSGDEISAVVDGVSGNENCNLSTTSSGKSVSFTGTVTGWSGTNNVYAFYPYSASGYTVSGGNNSTTATLLFTLPNPQSYTVDGAISNSFIVGAGTATSSAAVITASSKVHQVMSIVKLNITNAPAKVTGVKMICADAVFPTTATVKLNDGTISNPGSLTNTLSMTVTDNTVSSTKAVSLAMFPANLSSKSISIEVSFDGGYIKTISRTGLSFERNNHYRVAFDATSTTQYAEIGGIKWANGNLVANGANGAKIGLPTDGGLYFQYGSLVGWSGGATGDGTGRGTGTSTPTLAQTVKPSGYTGSTSWNSDWKGAVATDVASTGKGDPCRFYLGGSWRLPTQSELSALMNASGYPTTGPWQAQGSFTSGSSTSYAAHNTISIKLPAAGRRSNENGNLNNIGINGYYASSTSYESDKNYSIYFTSSTMNANYRDYIQATGYSVRCVRN